MNDLWRKARDAARDARLLYEGGSYDGACNRAYYAMFNAARALLVGRGHEPDMAKSHATVLRLFSLHFVKNGPFGAADGRALAAAGVARNRADYSSKATDSATVEDVMASLERFMLVAGQEFARGDDAEESNP